MRKTSSWILGAGFLAIMLVLGVSCQKKAVTVKTEPGQAEVMTAEEQAAAEAEAARAQAQREQERLKQQQAAEEARMREDAAKMSAEARRSRFEDEDIHFDFDKYVLKAEAMMLLDEKAAYLRENINARVLVEGHCDERGTNEYNLALGDRRANSAANYLIRSGIAADRLTTVSYGEERPMCMQSNESCWSRNRRAHFVLR